MKGKREEKRNKKTSRGNGYVLFLNWDDDFTGVYRRQNI